MYCRKSTDPPQQIHTKRPKAILELGYVDKCILAGTQPLVVHSHEECALSLSMMVKVEALAQDNLVTIVESAGEKPKLLQHKKGDRSPFIIIKYLHQ